MIPFEEIDSRLELIGKNRAWLVTASGRSENSIRAALAPGAPASKRSALLQKALSDAIEREESSRATVPPGFTEIFQSDEEIHLADQASRIVNAPSLAAFCHDVIQGEARRIIASQVSRRMLAPYTPLPEPEGIRVADDEVEYKVTPKIIELPFLGFVAAGQPVCSPALDETLPVVRHYPEKHFIVEINGQSAEPDFMDGDRWIIDGRDCYTPKHGKPCIVSDGHGSYLKKWNRSRQVFESINPAYTEVLPLDAATLQGYPVEKLI